MNMHDNLTNQQDNNGNSDHKYGYSDHEIMFMVLLTALTNFAVLPTILMLLKQKMIFHVTMSSFTLLCSFMYHFLDSIGSQRVFLTIHEWHRLDNIGSILCFLSLISYLSDLRNLYLEQALNYIGLLVCIFCQEADPWNINYTVGPILFWILMHIAIKMIQGKKPKLNKSNVKGGIFFMITAFYFFYRGLDDYNDYLRFYHGMWHLFVSFFAFWMWQSKLFGSDQYQIKHLFQKQKFKTNYYWPYVKEQNY